MTITSARYIDTDYVEITYGDDSQATLQYPAQDAGTHRHKELDEWVAGGGVIAPPPEDLPPLEANDAASAQSVAVQVETYGRQDADRRAVGAAPLISDENKTEFDDYQRQVYDAADAGIDAPEPPMFMRRAIILPGDVSGQCVITWKEFTGGWPGWGFKAEFQRGDITALGLKVYDENNAYLYALTFQATPQPDRWYTETPAGFATPTKVQRSFEIIAGSAPVSEFISLTDQVEYRSFIVRWQPGDPVT